MNGAPIDLIPDEMLVYVASFLVYDSRSRCAFARVCRRFCGMAREVFDQGPSFLHACQRGYAGLQLYDQNEQQVWTCRHCAVVAC